jgi:hypothetical protein
MSNRCVHGDTSQVLRKPYLQILGFVHTYNYAVLGLTVFCVHASTIYA